MRVSAPGGRAGEWCRGKAVPAGGGSRPASDVPWRRRGCQGCTAAGSHAQSDVTGRGRRRGGQVPHGTGALAVWGSCTRRAGGSASRVCRRSLARPPPRSVMLHEASCQASPTGAVTDKPGNAFIEGTTKAKPRATGAQHVIGVNNRPQPGSGLEWEPPRGCHRRWYYLRRLVGRRAPQPWHRGLWRASTSDDDPQTAYNSCVRPRGRLDKRGEDATLVIGAPAQQCNQQMRHRAQTPV